MIRIEGVPLPPPDPKLKRTVARFDGARPAVTPSLEAKAERVTNPVTEKPSKSPAGRLLDAVTDIHEGRVTEIQPVIPPSLHAKRVTNPVASGPVQSVTNPKPKGGRPLASDPSPAALRVRALRERRKASAP